MKLTPTERRAYELGWLAAQVATLQQIAGALRARADRTAKPEASLSGRLRAAFLADVDEAWRGVLRGLAQELEQQLAALRAEVDRRTRELEALGPVAVLERRTAP